MIKEITLYRKVNDNLIFNRTNILYPLIRVIIIPVQSEGQTFNKTQ